MTPDIESAKKYFNSPKGHLGFFDAYSSAYTTTNENLRCSMPFMPENTDNALTVAGSGDHPMFAMLYGAKHVDCFDISYNSKCIMDIKTAALQVLTHEEYCKLLMKLWSCTDVSLVPNMSKIIEKLPSEEQEYLLKMRGYRLFDHGCGTYTKYMVNDSEYEKMHGIVKEPFNFIWSDLQSLHLEKSYDFIHLSNVFDYVKGKNGYEYIGILANIMQYVKPGGVICFEASISGMQYFFDNTDVLRKTLQVKWAVRVHNQHLVLKRAR